MGIINFTDAAGNPLDPVDHSPANPAIDAGLRRLITVLDGNILFLDLDTLEQAGILDVGGQAGGSVRAVDTINHRIFYGDQRTISIFSLTSSFGPQSFTVPAPNVGQESIRAIAYDEERELLYVATKKSCCQGAANITSSSGLYSLDASSNTLNVRWFKDIDGCNEPLRGAGFQEPFLGIGTTGDFLYFACRGRTERNIQVTLHGVVRINLNAEAGSEDSQRFTQEFYPFGADLRFGLSFGDQMRNRIVIVPSGGLTNRIYIFDALNRSWTGSVPMGNTNMLGGVADPTTGRLYITDQGKTVGTGETSFAAVTDGESLPVPQGQRYSLGISDSWFAHPAFDPVTRRLFLPCPVCQTPAAPDGTQQPLRSHYRVYEDRTPLPEKPPEIDPDDETHQIVEVPGRTPITFSGSASAYGSREIFVGGQRAITGDPADPGTTQNLFSWVKKTEVSSSAATSAAIRSAQSQDTEQDTLSKQSSCKDFGGSDDKRTDSNAGSEVFCNLQDLTASGSATASNESSPTDSPVTVSSSWSTVKVFKDPVRGMVAKASAAAKGITIAGVIHIGEVQVDAETSAHGRDGTADSTFKTTIKGFIGPGGPCGFGNDTCDPQAVAAEINRTFQGRIQAFVPPRDLDPNVKGSDGGAQSIVVKDPYWYWSEFNVNTDAQKEVPGLQIVAYNDQDEASRNVIHLAAVFAESHYAIGLPPVEPPPEPALLKIVLTDDSEPPQPLSGGAFEVYADKDGNGDIDPLTDSVIQGGRCTTDEDGTGDCLFEELAAGDYVVHEVAAPGGYAPGPDTPVPLLPGSAATATFVNLPAIGFIDVSLTDDSQPPKPLAGGGFEVYADNGDLALGAGDQRLATCATSETGACMFDAKSIKGEAVVVQCKPRAEGSAKPDCTYDPNATEGNTLVVPLGTYIAREATAPGDYLPGEDRYETLASPYSQAHFRFVNGLKGIEGTPGAPGVSGSGGSTTPTTVEEGTGSPQATVTQQPLEPSEPNILLRIIRLPADIWRFLQRHPLEALLFGLLWILLGLPLWLGHRRRLGWLVARSATY